MGDDGGHISAREGSVVAEYDGGQTSTEEGNVMAEHEGRQTSFWAVIGVAEVDVGSERS